MHGKSTPPLHSPTTTTVSFNYSGNNALVFKSGNNDKRFAQTVEWMLSLIQLAITWIKDTVSRDTEFHYKCQAVSRWAVASENRVSIPHHSMWHWDRFSSQYCYATPTILFHICYVLVYMSVKVFNNFKSWKIWSIFMEFGKVR
jgi:hypothetical protein